MASFTLTANLVDLFARRIAPARVTVADGRIAATAPVERADGFLMPGFIDAHVHIESSMMVPTEFARLATRHGTVATVSDPHEIANVLGTAGVRFMVANGRATPFKFHWGVPSCVPATQFETAGATITSAAVRELFEQDGLGYLSEMMNYPGVLHGDPEVMEKIRIARELGKPVDGHAPGLRGDDARRYAAAGITTDHECVTLDEALDKITAGMTILIREGSAAKNFAALEPLLKSHPERCMFCSDDMHPDALVSGHINRPVARAVAGGANLFDVLRVACVNPVNHYGLPVGLLRVGDPADFILVDDLKAFHVRQTWIDGQCVFQDGESQLPRVPCDAPNRFAAEPVDIRHLRVRAEGSRIRVIGVRDGQLVTDELVRPANVQDGLIVADVAHDVLKFVVVNRYSVAPPALALIHGFGLKQGAIAGSVAHDSHNIVAVGATDDELVRAINVVVNNRGGLAVANGFHADALSLEVAGLMSRDGDAVAAGYARLDAAAKALGSNLAAPFMTLSFMALLVIPSLKLSDKGLFDGRTFQFTGLFC
jgi:adenine deaminase